MYLFFLSYIPLPITPGALKINGRTLSKTETLISGEEIIINRGHGLRTIEFDCLLQNSRSTYPFANYSVGKVYTATTFIVAFKALIAACQPFQFIVTRISPDGDILFFTNIKCVLGDYTIDEDAFELGQDVRVSIQLKEYLPFSTKTATIKTDDSGQKVATISENRDASSFSVPASVTTTSTDTLYNLAKTFTGDSNNLSALADFNGITNIFNVPSGTLLNIPQSLQTSNIASMLI